MRPTRRALLLVAAAIAAGAQAPPPSAQPTPAQPVPAQPAPPAAKPPVELLLDALKVAPDSAAAAALEAQITQMWRQQGSPAVLLLMDRGRRDLTAQTYSEAIADFDDAIALDPTLPEAFRQRAIARFQQGDVPGAIHDLEETLRRQPRYFPAFDTLSRIAESRKDWRGAYAAWQKLMDIDPQTPDGAQRLKDLRRRALGDQT